MDGRVIAEVLGRRAGRGYFLMCSQPRQLYHGKRCQRDGRGRG